MGERVSDRRAPHASGPTRALLWAADETLRKPCELRGRAAGEIGDAALYMALSRLARQGSLRRDGTGCYALTPLGERHRRVLEIALPAQLCRALLTLTPGPRRTADLIGVLAPALGISRFGVLFLLQRLVALDLAVRIERGGGRGHTSAYALTELGEATLPDAREVLAFLEEPS